MDFPIPLDYIPWLFAAVFGVIAVLIIYYMRLKPVYELPLANEQDLGIGKIWLSNLGRFAEGRMTTARNYFSDLFGKILASATSEDDKKKVLAFRSRVESRFLLAMREGRNKILFMSDANMMDERFCHRDPKIEGTPVFHIGPVQDCGSEGVYDGWEWVWVKLDKETKPYSPEQLPVVQNDAETMKYLRLAATNLSKIKVLEELNTALRDKSEQDNRTIAKVTAEKDIALKGLRQKSLANPESNKLPSTTLLKAKEWFGSVWQLVAMGIAYLVSPLIISLFSSSIPPTSTAYATLVVTIAGFFSIPLAKKAFGRWM